MRSAAYAHNTRSDFVIAKPSGGRGDEVSADVKQTNEMMHPLTFLGRVFSRSPDNSMECAE